MAVADELGMYAHPRPPLDGRNLKSALEALKKMVRDEGIERFVVGLPVTMSGVEGSAADKARTFAQKVANATGCEVELWDERLSTVEAHRALQGIGFDGRDRKGKVDGVAAALVLESWLAAQSPGRKG